MGGRNHVCHVFTRIGRVGYCCNVNPISFWTFTTAIYIIIMTTRRIIPSILRLLISAHCHRTVETFVTFVGETSGYPGVGGSSKSHQKRTTSPMYTAAGAHYYYCRAEANSTHAGTKCGPFVRNFSGSSVAPQ